MDGKIEVPLRLVQLDVQGARRALEQVYADIDAGDFDTALERLHSELFQRLEDARIEGQGAVDRLRELGGRYPRRSRG